MRQFSNILKKNGLEVLKYTIRGRATIVKTPLGKFVFKKNNGCDIYKYLSSKNNSIIYLIQIRPYIKTLTKISFPFFIPFILS